MPGGPNLRLVSPRDMMIMAKKVPELVSWMEWC